MSRAEEAALILKEYDLFDSAQDECKNKGYLIPLDMKNRNMVWCEWLGKIYIDIKTQMEAVSESGCKLGVRKCFPDCILGRIRPQCEKCDTYKTKIIPLYSKMERVVEVKRALKDEGDYDESHK